MKAVRTFNISKEYCQYEISRHILTFIKAGSNVRGYEDSNSINIRGSVISNSIWFLRWNHQLFEKPDDIQSGVGGLDEGRRRWRQWTQSIQSLNNLSRSIINLSRSIINLFSSITNLSRSITNLSRSITNLSRSITNLSRSIINYLPTFPGQLRTFPGQLQTFPGQSPTFQVKKQRFRTITNLSRSILCSGLFMINRTIFCFVFNKSLKGAYISGLFRRSTVGWSPLPFQVLLPPDQSRAAPALGVHRTSTNPHNIYHILTIAGTTQLTCQNSSFLGAELL